MDVENNFGVIDYCAFAGVLAISGCIGFYFSYKGNKSPEEFLMGNRSIQTFAVAISLMTSCISAISILGSPAEVYANGMQLYLLIVGVILANIFSSYFIIPILFPLKLTSINEYISLRFKSEWLRTALFAVMIIKFLIGSGIVLYAPTIALSSITKFSTTANIFLLGIVCTTYSAFGGIRAVIWTDVFQLLVMAIGLVTVVTVGCSLNGGIVEVLYTSSKGGRLDMFNMNPSPFVRHTFFNILIFGFLNTVRLNSIEQFSIQRIYAVKSLKKAKNVLIVSLYAMIIVNTLIFVGGLVAYATYFGCDPMALGTIAKKDQIMPYFIMDKLSFIPGLQGLYTATLIGGALSSLSSFINSCVALLWRDVFLKFGYFKEISQMGATMTNKILSLAIGVVVIALAILTSNTSGLIELSIIIDSTFSGPILGVFFIGFFLPKCNIKGVWIGFLLSSVFALWISLGGLLYKTPTKMLPFSADECDNLNSSSFAVNKNQKLISSSNSSNNNEELIDDQSIISIYQISYTLYIVIGLTLCLLSALFVSCITGNQKLSDVSPKLVSPYVHKFFWTNEKINTMSTNETPSMKCNEET